MSEGNFCAGCEAETLEPKFIELKPAADIIENENGVTVQLEVPGANSSTVDVEVKDQVLSITAKSSLKAGDGFIAYKRAFNLSDAVDVENISAATKDGVLTIELPKSEKARVHKIKVN